MLDHGTVVVAFHEGSSLRLEVTPKIEAVHESVDPLFPFRTDNRLSTGTERVVAPAASQNLGNIS